MNPVLDQDSPCKDKFRNWLFSFLFLLLASKRRTVASTMRNNQSASWLWCLRHPAHRTPKEATCSQSCAKAEHWTLDGSLFLLPASSLSFDHGSTLLCPQSGGHSLYAFMKRQAEQCLGVYQNGRFCRVMKVAAVWDPRVSRAGRGVIARTAQHRALRLCFLLFFLLAGEPAARRTACDSSGLGPLAPELHGVHSVGRQGQESTGRQGPVDFELGASWQPAS